MFSFFAFFSVFLFLLLVWIDWKYRRFFFTNREKSSPFECGFDPKDSARVPFSLRFFFLLVVFVMFDVEFALILHLPSIIFEWFFFFIFAFLLFLLVMSLGTLEEYRRGVFKWKS